jgi:competence protein ComFB
LNATKTSLTNYMEDAVRSVLEEMICDEAYQNLTMDPKLKLDVMAYALNRLPAKYVVSDRGHLYTRVQELRQQFKTDIVVELTKAIQHVLAHPRK